MFEASLPDSVRTAFAVEDNLDGVTGVLPAPPRQGRIQSDVSRLLLQITGFVVLLIAVGLARIGLEYLDWSDGWWFWGLLLLVIAAPSGMLLRGRWQFGRFGFFTMSDIIAEMPAGTGAAVHREAGTAFSLGYTRCRIGALDLAWSDIGSVAISKDPVNPFQVELVLLERAGKFWRWQVDAGMIRPLTWLQKQLEKKVEDSAGSREVPAELVSLIDKSTQ